MQKMFQYQNISETRKGPLRKFLALWHKKCSIEISDMPFLCINIFDTQFFLKHRRVPLRKFLVMLNKKFINKKYWNPLIVRKFFRKTFFFETEKGCHTKFFGTVRHGFWQKNVKNTPLLLSKIILDTRSFLKHRRVPLRVSSVLWDKNFDKKLWYTRLFSYP